VTDKTDPTSYAMHIADASFAWYRTAAIRARRLYRSAEISVIVVSALVPLSAVVLPGNTIVAAALGSAVVVITGLRSVFHWHENYLRFSHAREAVEAERRRFRTGVKPYDDHRNQVHTGAQRCINLVPDRVVLFVEPPSTRPRELRVPGRTDQDQHRRAGP
jgi:Protein of unknown function (DUF4231)